MQNSLQILRKFKFFFLHHCQNKTGDLSGIPLPGGEASGIPDEVSETVLSWPSEIRAISYCYTRIHTIHTSLVFLCLPYLFTLCLTLDENLISKSDSLSILKVYFGDQTNIWVYIWAYGKVLVAKIWQLGVRSQKVMSTTTVAWHSEHITAVSIVTVVNLTHLLK